MTIDDRGNVARRIRLAGIGVSIVLGAAAASGADHPGKAPYEQYCASCHGVDADGKGPVASELKVPPADLRQLGRKYGNPLPVPKLREFIDGRGMVRGHGTSEMPVWGEAFKGGAPATPRAELFGRGTILSILDYLQTLQAK